MNHSLTQGPITRNMLLFALPLMLGNLLQQMYNLADAWVVGRFLGPDALAAVGSSYTLMTFLTSILLGLCMGSGAAISMQYGAGQQDRLRRCIFLSFGLIAVLSLVLNGAVYLGMDGILWVLRVPAEIRPLMQDYLAVVFLGILATFLYNYYASLLRAIGNSVVPLVFLAVSAVLNVVLDLGCVVGLGWGVKGAALATVAAQFVSGIGIAVYAWRCFPQLRPRREDCRWDRAALASILNLSVMTSVQQSIMNFGILMVQGLVNSFGPVTMAAFAAAVKIDSFAYLPVQDFGNAFSTFVAQNHGAHQPQRIRQGIRSARSGVGGILHCYQRFGLCVCCAADECFHRPGTDPDHPGGGTLSADRRRLLYRHRGVVFAVWVLPGSGAACHVGGADHCFPGHPGGAGVCAQCDGFGCDWYLAQRSHRLGAGRWHRHWVLFLFAKTGQGSTPRGTHDKNTGCAAAQPVFYCIFNEL